MKKPAAIEALAIFDQPVMRCTKLQDVTLHSYTNAPHAIQVWFIAARYPNHPAAQKQILHDDPAFHPNWWTHKCDYPAG